MEGKAGKFDHEDQKDQGTVLEWLNGFVLFPSGFPPPPSLSSPGGAASSLLAPSSGSCCARGGLRLLGPAVPGRAEAVATPKAFGVFRTACEGRVGSSDARADQKTGISRPECLSCPQQEPSHRGGPAPLRELICKIVTSAAGAGHARLSGSSSCLGRRC